jgi:hypothetical protein
MTGGAVTPGGWRRRQLVRATDTPGHWRVLTSWRLRDYDRHLWASITPRAKPSVGDFADDIVVVKLYPADPDAFLYAAQCHALGPNRLERHADDLTPVGEKRPEDDRQGPDQEGLW